MPRPPDQVPAFDDVEQLLRDQRRRWSNGERVFVEDYLRRHPALLSSAAQLLDVVYNEILLREEHGETPVVHEYTRRFPTLSKELEDQFDVHGALRSSSWRQDDPTAEAPTWIHSLRPVRQDVAPFESGAAKRERRPREPADLPKRFGRYAVRKQLGQGGFGTVYLGHDDELHRAVAIKVPHAHCISSDVEAARLLEEARKMARLSHPHIVSVYDVGREGDACYIVSEYIDGSNLATRASRGNLKHGEVLRIVAHVASALEHAHVHGLIHRDIKPANILLDAEDKPYVTDFGLAISQDEGRNLGQEIAGTPLYMAPEQIRAEDHRIDDRTDIYSLGVVLFELLCGKPPFEAGSLGELFEQVTSAPTPSPRAVRPELPPECDRICTKAMARRPSDRYARAQELADDLLAFVRHPNDSPRGSKPAIVPKGLRAFGPEDADFFLRLLPGPRDREGLPDSVRFWKQQLEDTSPASAFRAGLLYGPSGSGKSSLVRAGILPHLAPRVVPIFVEATRHGTTFRLKNAVLAHFPELERRASLVDLLLSLRRHLSTGNEKVVVFLDQFEQWLHAHPSQLDSTELVQALRQTDGAHLQCVFLVRDEFWVATARLFRALEAPRREDENMRLVDLFDEEHARHVIELLGRAYGRLPPAPRKLSAQERAFCKNAVAGLADDGRVICVRLSLFCEMLKDRPWNPATLRDVGGVEGVGFLFLERAFGKAAPPELRDLEAEARSLLARLLPATDHEIKGESRSLRELAVVTNLTVDAPRFERLLEVLGRQLQLISPAESGAETDPSDGNTHLPASEPRYQLSHDYLVPSLRAWLAVKRSETWRGRARILLEERTAGWHRSRERRKLPSLFEQIRILGGVPRRSCTTEESELRRAATRHHGVRLLATAGIVTVAILVLLSYRSQWHSEQAEVAVARAISAAPAAVPYAIEALQPLADPARQILRAELTNGIEEPAYRLHAACALSALGETRVEDLISPLEAIEASVADCSNVATALRESRHPSAARQALKRVLDGESPLDARFRAAVLLLHLDDPSSARAFLETGEDPTHRTHWIENFAAWHGPLEDVLAFVQPDAPGPFLSGLVLSLGTLEPTSLSPQMRTEVQGALQDVFLASPHGGSHSAALWALTKWEADIPEPEPSRHAPDDRQWFVSPMGLTMLRIPAGSFRMGDPDPQKNVSSRPHHVTLSEPYFICDREVWVDLFQEFLVDPDVPPSGRLKPTVCDTADPLISPRGDCPMQSVSWEGAVLFCNWLSQREGRKPSYRHEEILSVGWVGEPGNCRIHSWTTWTCDFEADGYRLPTEAEWEYACRARTTKSYFFGEASTLPLRYGVTSNDRKRPTLPAAAVLPNPWGLFHVHGNVWEYTWDWFEIFPVHPTVDPRGGAVPHGFFGAKRSHRGGGVDNARGNPDSSSRGFGGQLECFWNVGFRVVCRGQN